MSVISPFQAGQQDPLPPDEDAARTVMLVKAVEDGDGKQEVVPPADRRWATREAGPPAASAAAPHILTPAEASFVVRRACLLARVLEPRFPALAAARQGTRWRSGVASVLAAACFAFGVLSNELGTARQVNILAFPLLGMLAWNLAVYAILFVRAVRVGRTNTIRSPEATRGPWLRLASQLLLRSARSPRARVHPVLAASIASFTAQWSRAASPLYAARVRRVLHVCAVLLAVGAVAGLYLRGIAFEYRAVWESTFLDAHAAHLLLAIVLGPASALTGIALPDENALAALRWAGSGSGENAARWIHLYAATALLFIVLPRTALALGARRTERRLSRDFPLPDDIAPYCRRLLAERHVHERVVAAEVIAVNRALSAGALGCLQAALVSRLGVRVAATLRGTVAYGEEEDHLAARSTAAPQAGCTVLVFDATATPEEENHGLLLHGYRPVATADHPLLVVLDVSAYQRRLAAQAGAQARLAERVAAWERLAQAHGIELLPLDLEPFSSATEA